MVKFCSKCGSKIENDSDKFCPSCGEIVDVVESANNASSDSSGIKCLYCGNIIPIGSDKCFKCGKYINPKANKSHKGAIVAGYILLFVPILSFIPIILGIYLLTRPNKNVHKHGIIMIVLSIISVILWSLFLIGMYSHYHSTYYYSDSYYSTPYYRHSYYSTPYSDSYY